MSEFAKIAFAPIAAPDGGALVVFVGGDLKPGAAAAIVLGEAAAAIDAAAKTVGFKGKALTALDILAPTGLAAARLIVVGVAPAKDGKPLDFAALGGHVAGKLGKSKTVCAIFE